VKLGLFGINMGGLADPESMARVAVAAEEAGFE
jgi:probable F420-dependent oxidoreductase